jgi:hypothetical protein
LKHDLEQAEEELAAVQRHIARQHQKIWDLDQAKQDTTEAQALHITHRHQIIKALEASS